MIIEGEGKGGYYRREEEMEEEECHKYTPMCNCFVIYYNITVVK